MNWHYSPDVPDKAASETEILAEVKGFEHARFVVLRYDPDYGWWQHLPRMNVVMPTDGWVGTQELEVIRWTYIEEL